MEFVLNGFEEISLHDLGNIDGGINWGEAAEKAVYYAFSGGTAALGAAAGAAVGGPVGGSIGAKAGAVIGGAAGAYVADLIWGGIN